MGLRPIAWMLPVRHRPGFYEIGDRVGFTLRRLMAGLGSRWTPPSRQALVALLTEIAKPSSDGLSA